MIYHFLKTINSFSEIPVHIFDISFFVGTCFFHDIFVIL